MYTFQGITYGSSLIQHIRSAIGNVALLHPAGTELSLQPCHSSQPRLHARCSIHSHAAEMESLMGTQRASKLILQGFLQPAGLLLCTHPLEKGKTQFASPVAAYAYDKERWEGSDCPLGDEIIPYKYVTHYSEIKDTDAESFKKHVRISSHNWPKFKTSCSASLLHCF